MSNQDLIVTDNGQCHAFDIDDDAQLPANPYRLYRFLTDIEDILQTISNDYKRLQLICPLVRRLLNSSYWLQGVYKQPHPKLGWSVEFLYQEPDFPLTVQNVAWLPGQASPIHNHGAWGIVALLSGQETNRLWRRTAEPDWPDRIELVGDRQLFPGDIIGFTPDAIHNVEAIGDEPTISFNIYGKTNYDQRFEFDPTNNTAKKF
ncbi:MAG: cupin [Cyanothece sp. SIO1E1]|nr:cupin [Cyanothece sp. SIO1E1]